MSIDLGEKEYKMLKMLKINARTPITEMVSTLGVSRITAKRMLASLIKRGIIKSFTIETGQENDPLLVVELESIEGIDQDIIIDDFRLLDGTHIITVPFSDSFKLEGIKVKRIHISTGRKRNTGSLNIEGIKCDFCGRKINSDPLKIRDGNSLYYVCCTSCETNLKKRLEAMK
ncbi:TRASH domain-containing protein [Oxyplasma meridianum]|uniref:TRASH domain-containing protein n=1 Tax=Oxyplasma meridianum TaxID=3073602 RepID=A0AAX4NEH1_9ARCH